MTRHRKSRGLSLQRLAPRRGEEGFSIIELLIAMIVMAIVSTILLSFITGFGRSAGANASSNKAEAALLDSLNRTSRDITVSGTILYASASELVTQDTEQLSSLNSGKVTCTRTEYTYTAPVNGVVSLTSREWVAPSSASTCTANPYTTGGAFYPTSATYGAKTLATDVVEPLQPAPSGDVQDAGLVSGKIAPLFTYYDVNGGSISAAESGTSDTTVLRSIARITISATGLVTVRSNKLGYAALTTSAALIGNFGGVVANQSPNTGSSPIPTATTASPTASPSSTPTSPSPSPSTTSPSPTPTTYIQPIAGCSGFSASPGAQPTDPSVTSGTNTILFTGGGSVSSNYSGSAVNRTASGATQVVPLGSQVTYTLSGSSTCTVSVLQYPPIPTPNQFTPGFSTYASPLSAALLSSPHVSGASFVTSYGTPSSNVSDGTNLFSWNPSTSATSYSVYKTHGQYSYGQVNLLATGITGSTYTDYGVPLGTQYVYGAVAQNATGSSPNVGEPFYLNTPITQRPAAPNFTSVLNNYGGQATPYGSGYEDTTGGNSATYNWNSTADTNNPSYAFCNSSSCSYTLYHGTGSHEASGYALSAQVNDMTWGGTYYYYLGACNPGGCSAHSSLTQMDTFPGPFGIGGHYVRAGYHFDTNTYSMASGRQTDLINLQWSTSAGANAYTYTVNGSPHSWQNCTQPIVNCWGADRVLPGSGYGYVVSSRASNGLVRTLPNYEVRTAPGTITSISQVWQCRNYYQDWRIVFNAYNWNAVYGQSKAYTTYGVVPLYNGRAYGVGPLWDYGPPPGGYVNNNNTSYQGTGINLVTPAYPNVAGVGGYIVAANHFNSDWGYNFTNDTSAYISMGSIQDVNAPYQGCTFNYNHGWHEPYNNYINYTAGPPPQQITDSLPE